MSEWISIDEQIPEVGECVLLYAIDGNCGVMYARNISDYAASCLERDEHDPAWDAVTHWMPLPEPPKDGE